MTRPARSISPPSLADRGDPRTPAAQSTVAVGMNFATGLDATTVDFGDAARPGPRRPGGPDQSPHASPGHRGTRLRMRGPPSIKMILAWAGFMLRKSRAST